MKIEIPVKRARYATSRRMMGSKMMSNKIINRNQFVVDESKLKKLIEELVEGKDNVLDIYRNEQTDWSLIFSINLSGNSKIYNVRAIVSAISKKYFRN